MEYSSFENLSKQVRYLASSTLCTAANVCIESGAYVFVDGSMAAPVT